MAWGLQQAEVMSSRIPLILVAEDEDQLRTLIAHRLSTDGLHVVELEDGLEVSDYVTLAMPGARPVVPMPDLILTDVRMPGLSGLEVIRSFRRVGLTFPVVVLTAFPDDSVYAEASRLGDTVVVSKPVDLDELTQIVRSRLLDAGRRESPRV